MQETGTPEVHKSKRQASIALVGLLAAVAVFAAAFVAFDGAEIVADLMSGDEVAETVVPPKPSVPTEDEATTAEPAEEPEESAQTTETESATETDDTASAGSVTPAVTSPTGDQLSRMFWEQVGSQEQIGKLVAGEISGFSLGTVTNNGTSASIGVSANYKAGGSLGGTMVLRNYSGVWYFSSISSAGGGTTVKSIPADTGITSTIVAQTPTNQDIPKAIIGGGYKTVTVNSVSAGSGTATVSITLSGGTSARVSGTILCTSKTIGGTKYWFITSFRRA